MTAKEYFNQTYDATYTSVLRYISLRLSGSGAYHDVCDVLQDTYAEFYKLIVKRGADYANEPLAMLYKIAGERLARKYAQRKRIAATVPLFSRPEQDEEERCIADFQNGYSSIDEEGVLDHMLAEQILTVIKEGDEQSARIFMLRYENDMKLDEIAAATGLPLHTVRNKLYRKIEELKRIFNGGE